MARIDLKRTENGTGLRIDGVEYPTVTNASEKTGIAFTTLMQLKKKAMKAHRKCVEHEVKVRRTVKVEAL